jgi:hypothetical protein
VSLFSLDGSGNVSFISTPDPNIPSDANTDNIYEVSVSVCDSHACSKCNLQTFHIDL